MINFKDKGLLDMPIAHRGLHDGNKSIPENTLAAFKKAIEKKYPVELDIQLTKDNTIIVFHDTSLVRACNQRNRIENLTYNEIAEINIFNTVFKIPTLKDVLELVNERVPILIDIKNYTIQKRLEKKLLAELKTYNGIVALQSFNPFTVKWLKKHSRYCIGYLVSKYNYLHFFNYFLMDTKNSIDFLAIDKKLLNTNYFTRLSKKGIPILLWTLSGDKEKNGFKNYYDNYIFENRVQL